MFLKIVFNRRNRLPPPSLAKLKSRHSEARAALSEKLAAGMPPAFDFLAGVRERGRQSPLSKRGFLPFAWVALFGSGLSAHSDSTLAIFKRPRAAQKGQAEQIAASAAIPHFVVCSGGGGCSQAGRG
jgi:hypothetical protein